MDNFLDRYHIPKLNQDQVNNLNKLINCKEIEAVINNWILIHTYEQLTFDKKLKLYSGKKKESPTNDIEITGCQHIEQCK